MVLGPFLRNYLDNFKITEIPKKEESLLLIDIKSKNSKQLVETGYRCIGFQNFQDKSYHKVNNDDQLITEISSAIINRSKEVELWVVGFGDTIEDVFNSQSYVNKKLLKVSNAEQALFRVNDLHTSGKKFVAIMDSTIIYDPDYLLHRVVNIKNSREGTSVCYSYSNGESIITKFQEPVVGSILSTGKSHTIDVKTCYDFVTRSREKKIETVKPRTVPIIDYAQSLIDKVSYLNTGMVDNVYIISLKHETKTRRMISDYFEKYGIQFQFFDAVYGKEDNECIKLFEEYNKLEHDNPKTHILQKKYRRKMLTSVGAVGLLKTFKMIFHDAKTRKYNKIAIFDDDVMFDKDFNKKLYTVSRYAKDYKLFFLGCSQHTPLPNDYSIYNQHYYKNSYYTDGSFATCYDKSTFNTLLQEIDKYNISFDSGPVREVLKNYPGEAYTIYPNIVIADTTDPSGTGNSSRNLRTHCKKVKWDLSNIDFTRGTQRVSVIVPTYNSEKDIIHTLKSVLKQTYSNVEIIVVDDKSNDNTVNIVKNMAKQHPSINLIQMEQNGGAYKARVEAVKRSTGFFITLLDSDDLYLPTKIETSVYNYFNNSKYGIFFSCMYRSNKARFSGDDDYSTIIKKIDDERKPYIVNNPHAPFGHNAPWKYKLRFGLPTIFVERSFFTKYGLWRTDYRYSMDLEIVQRYILMKYGKLLQQEEIWSMIYVYKGSEYGIKLVPTLDYVSQPMTEKNATVINTKDDRKIIGEQCYSDLKDIDQYKRTKIEYLNF